MVIERRADGEIMAHRLRPDGMRRIVKTGRQIGAGHSYFDPHGEAPLALGGTEEDGQAPASSGIMVLWYESGGNTYESVISEYRSESERTLRPQRDKI